MPSPDLGQYSPRLELFDKDPQQVFQAALVNLQSRLPGWRPREGHTEVLLMESLALEVSESVFALNRLPGAMLEVLLRLYGIERDIGQEPRATLRFNLSDAAGHTIPLGTRVRLELDNGLPPLVFATVDVLTVPPGSTTGTVDALGDRLTEDANGVAPPRLFEIVDAVTFVDFVELVAPISDGRDAESDDDWQLRGIARFARLTEALVLPRHFQQAALDAGAFRALAVDNYNPSVAGVPGDHPGHVTVAVYGENDVPMSAAAKQLLDDDFEARAQANLAVHVVDPTVTPVDVTVTVRRLAGFTDVQVRDAVLDALTAYLNPNTWEWAGVVRVNELIALVDRADGVDYVVSLTAPAGDVTLTGVAPLVRPGTLTVTVTA